MSAFLDPEEVNAEAGYGQQPAPPVRYRGPAPVSVLRERAAEYAAEVNAIRNLNRRGFRQKIHEMVEAERTRQFEKWGDQRRPLGAGRAIFKDMADVARRRCDKNDVDGTASWSDIATEEFYEALAEGDRDAFRTEAIQTIAVLYAALEDQYREEFE